MKTKHTIVPIAIVSTAFAIITAPKSEAAGCDELSRGAHRIDSIAHELEDEFRIHYRHLCAYRHLRSNVAEVISITHHIDRLSQDVHPPLGHISADLRDLDRLAHRLHELVDDAERGRHRGHVRGSTRHVHSLLGALNRSIHSMQRTVDDLRFHGDHRRERFDRHDERYGWRGRGRQIDVAAGRFRFAIRRP